MKIISEVILSEINKKKRKRKQEQKFIKLSKKRKKATKKDVKPIEKPEKVEKGKVEQKAPIARSSTSTLVGVQTEEKGETKQKAETTYSTLVGVQPEEKAETKRKVETTKRKKSISWESKKEIICTQAVKKKLKKLSCRNNLRWNLFLILQAAFCLLLRPYLSCHRLQSPLLLILL